MKLEEAQYRDDVYQAEVDRWTCPADAMRALVGAAAGLFESYRGGPFGVCQRTVRDVERQLFFYAQAAKVRFCGDDLAAPAPKVEAVAVELSRALGILWAFLEHVPTTPEGAQGYRDALVDARDTILRLDPGGASRPMRPLTREEREARATESGARGEEPAP